MKKKICVCVLIGLALLLAGYAGFEYFLVSAFLIPDFMEKLDSFEEVSELSFAEQVHTADIRENHAAAIEETREWLEEAGGRRVTLRSADGYELVASEFLTDGDSHNWALLLHGYTGSKEDMYPIACRYHRMGYNVLVPDLRCQGESGGDFIGMGLTDAGDCLLWLDKILETDSAARLVLHGQSMGAATALIMTGEPELSSHVVAAIADCSYTDAYTMFSGKLEEWFHLPSYLFADGACLMLRLRGGYDLKKASPADAVSRSHTPTLFIHGDEDDMVDVAMCRELYGAASCEKELLIVQGAGHAQSQDKDPEGYYSAVEEFIGRMICANPYASETEAGHRHT